MRGLKGRRVLVTGGATGIGLATVRRLADEGCSVAVNHLGMAAAAAALVEELGGAHPDARFHAIEADIAEAEAITRMFAEAAARLGGLDILVNNAGIKAVGLPHEVTTDDLDRVLGINLRGAFLCAQAAIRHFLDAGQSGVVVTTSSIHQVVPMPEATAYMVAKSGLAGLTTTLALAYADRNIRVVAVGPGAIMTPMNHDLAEDPEKLRAIEAAIPMQRVAAPDEIASVIAFLASDEASYITGQTVFADGGLMLGRPNK